MFIESLDFMENIFIDSNMITVIPFSENLKQEWEHFVEFDALNSTFLHSRKFYDHNPLNAIDDASLMFYKGKHIVAVFPAVLYRLNGSLILNSHLRSTYGGLVISKDVDVNLAVQLIELVVLFAKSKNVHQIVIRNSFRILHRDLCDSIDYAVWLNGFEIKSREIEIAISISGSKREIQSQYHRSTAKNVKKALQSVTVNISTDYEQYWDFLENTIMLRHGKRPVHNLHSFEKLKKNIHQDGIILFGAYFNQKLIAGIVVFNFGNSVLHCQYLGYDFGFLHLRPVHAIVDFIIDWGILRGIKYLNLGMANEDEGHKINFGLLRLKESFGGRGVLRETMFLNL